MSADTPPISEIETKVMQYTCRFKINTGYNTQVVKVK